MSNTNTQLGILQNGKLLLHGDESGIMVIWNNLSGKNFAEVTGGMLEYEKYIKFVAIPEMGIDVKEKLELVEIISIEPLNYVNLSKTTIKTS